MPVPESHQNVRRFLSASGYSDHQIVDGITYAGHCGWRDADHLGQLALSRILYNDAQLENGKRVGWECVDWSEWN